MSILVMFAGLGLLLVLQAFFSGAEIAIVNCDRNKLKHRAKQGDAGSKLALELLERPEVILSTTLVGTNISLVLLTAIATTAMIAAVGDRGDFYATLLLIPVTLILGEVVPKSVFQQRANELTPRICKLYLLSPFLRPEPQVYRQYYRCVIIYLLIYITNSA